MSRLPRAPTPTWLRWQAAALGALAVACVLTTTGCTSLSPEALEPIDQPVTAVAFENARGEVSAGKSAAIVQSLERSAGDSDILDKHLAVEQAINADSPLVLGNKLTLPGGGQAAGQGKSGQGLHGFVSGPKSRFVNQGQRMLGLRLISENSKLFINR